MKNLDLNAYGVVEMNDAEMREVEGGWGRVGAYIIMMLVDYVIGDFDDFQRGYNDAKN
ncbi:MAG: hypothetical protein LBI15_02575 [Dysgonamonadaceae bacterium]|jgi:hypothetical protein|nr:hypothetical protein [Dysgonamonadaceae bacterium]